MRIISLPPPSALSIFAETVPSSMYGSSDGAAIFVLPTISPLSIVMVAPLDKVIVTCSLAGSDSVTVYVMNSPSYTCSLAERVAVIFIGPSGCVPDSVKLIPLIGSKKVLVTPIVSAPLVTGTSFPVASNETIGWPPPSDAGLPMPAAGASSSVVGSKSSDKRASWISSISLATSERSTASAL